MTVRKWLTTAVVAAGLGLGATTAARPPTPRPSTPSARSRPPTPEAAKAQAEAWLKKAGKFDQAAFDKVWAEDEASVLDRTIATLELGSAEAKKVMDAGPQRRDRAPKDVPAILKDEKPDTYFRANLALGLRPRADQRPRVRGVARRPQATSRPSRRSTRPPTSSTGPSPSTP